MYGNPAIPLAAVQFTIKVRSTRGTALIGFVEEKDARSYWSEMSEGEIQEAVLYGPGIDEVLARYVP